MSWSDDESIEDYTESESDFVENDLLDKKETIEEDLTEDENS